MSKGKKKKSGNHRKPVTEFDTYLKGALLFTHEHMDGNTWTGSGLDSRIIKAVKNVGAEMDGTTDSSLCLGSVCCWHGGSPHMYMQEYAAAFYIREIIELQDDIDVSKKLYDILSSEQLSRLKIRDQQISNILNDPMIDGIYKIIHYRYCDTPWRFPVNDERRRGPAWDLYGQLKGLMPEKAVQTAIDCYMQQFKVQWDMALKISNKLNDDGSFVKKDNSGSNAPYAVVNTPNLTPMQSKVVNTAFRQVSEEYETMIGLASALAGVKNEGTARIRTILEKYDLLSILTDYDRHDQDPFSVLAGYCFLEDIDSDYVYIPGISIRILCLYTDILPWCGTNERIDIPEKEQKSPSPYARKTNFNDSSDPDDPNVLQVGPADMIYRLSGHVMTPVEAVMAMDKLQNKTISADACVPAAVLTACALTTERNRSSQQFRLHNQETENKTDEAVQSAKEESDKQIADIEDKYTSEIEHLQSELESAQKSLNQAEHDKKEAERKLAESESKNTRERDELYSLREYIYTISDENTPDDSDDDSGFTFPFESKRRIVIYGGHDTWRNGLKEKLLNVTLAPKGDSVDRNLIRNAEEVWIQCNCISHPMYNRVCDIADKSDVPIKYFSTAGVNSCAVQIAAGG